MKTEKQRRRRHCCCCCWQSLLGGWASLALSRSLTGLSAAAAAAVAANAAATLRPAFAAAARVVLAFAHILCVHILQHCCQSARVGGGVVWGLLFSLCVLFLCFWGCAAIGRHLFGFCLPAAYRSSASAPAANEGSSRKRLTALLAHTPVCRRAVSLLTVIK